MPRGIGQYDPWARLSAAVMTSSCLSLEKAQWQLVENPDNEEAAMTIAREMRFLENELTPFRRYLEIKGHEFDLSKLQ